HEVWRLQGKNTRGSARRQLPGTDTRNFSKVRGLTAAANCLEQTRTVASHQAIHNFTANCLEQT
ncbi:15889_t:CDS:1, partial [Funneliformis geosporum]